jgi:hypothetical protein
MKGRKVFTTRAGRRVFAQKARPTILTLSNSYIARGGGYLWYLNIVKVITAHSVWSIGSIKLFCV